MSNLLWNPGLKIKKKYIKKPASGTTSVSGGVLLKAGTPLNASGQVANTANAVMIVAEDHIFYAGGAGRDTGVSVITGGYVDLAKAQEAWGKTYTSEAKESFASHGIVVVDGTLDSANVGADPGYSASEIVLFESNDLSLTPVSPSLWFTSLGEGIHINAPVVTVTMDGREYTAERKEILNAQGEVAFVKYGDDTYYFHPPFFLLAQPWEGDILFENIRVGYEVSSLKISVKESSESSSFASAVNVVSEPSVVYGKLRYFMETNETVSNVLYSEVLAATKKGKPIILMKESKYGSNVITGSVYFTSLDVPTIYFTDFSGNTYEFYCDNTLPPSPDSGGADDGYIVCDNDIFPED